MISLQHDLSRFILRVFVAWCNWKRRERERGASKREYQAREKERERERERVHGLPCPLACRRCVGWWWWFMCARACVCMCVCVCACMCTTAKHCSLKRTLQQCIHTSYAEQQVPPKNFLNNSQVWQSFPYCASISCSRITWENDMKRLTLCQDTKQDRPEPNLLASLPIFPSSISPKMCQNCS